jgi:hypothetical protein
MSPADRSFDQDYLPVSDRKNEAFATVWQKTWEDEALRSPGANMMVIISVNAHTKGFAKWSNMKRH